MSDRLPPDGRGPVPDLAMKAVRRLLTVHKPFVRRARRRAREAEQRQYRDEAMAVDREIAAIAAAPGPIVVGPWLAEVGYEVLYWIPLLRWLADRHGIGPERLVVISRGGVGEWYADLASTYVDILDVMTPEELAAGNATRQETQEGGGQKQMATGALDAAILAAAAKRAGFAVGAVLHPSLLFRLFRQVWYGNLPLDFFWTRTHYTRVAPGSRADLPTGLPPEFAAVKFYSGRALPLTDANRATVRALVSGLAATMPVVSLDADFGLDEHRDFDLSGIPNVLSARAWMTPATNLAVQSRVIGQARAFAGTCGGLAWLAPFLGVPTVAVYEDDHLLGTHLAIARQAGRAAAAAEFAPFDIRAGRRLGVTP